MRVKMAQYGIAHAHASGKADAMKRNSDVDFCGVFEPDPQIRAGRGDASAYKDVHWFKSKEEIVCYVGSNAATPTATLEALTDAVKAGNPSLPFLKMVHLLLQGTVPYVAAGLQDRMMTYSIFSAGEVRQAANEGRAYYLPCTLANLDSLVGKDRAYEPDVVFIKIRQNEYTGEYSLGVSTLVSPTNSIGNCSSRIILRTTEKPSN